MKIKLGGMGVVALATSVVVAACSSDGGSDFMPAPNTSGSNQGGSSGNNMGGAHAGSAGSSAGNTAAGNPTGGTPALGGTAGGGNGGSAGTDVGVAGEGGLGGDAGASGAPTDGGATGSGGDSAGGDGAGGDGGVIVQPVACDFTEVENSMTQSTGLNTNPNAKLLCGKLDTGNYIANEKIVDRDRYSINVASGNVVIKVELASLAGFTKIELKLDNEIRLLTQPVTVLTIPSTFTGVLLSLTGYGEADAPQAVSYKLSVLSGGLDARCPAGAGAAAYTEAADGNDSRGNDLYVIDDPTVTLTAANDAAEVTNLTLAKASSYLVKGKGGDVTRIEDYWDGDSYAFHTGAGVTQVTLRTDWTGSKDMDIWVFPVGSTTPVGNGVYFGNTSPEFATVKVEPNTDYIAFVGYSSANAKPFDYSLTLCGETYGLK